MTYYFPAIIKKTATGYHVRYVDLQDCFGEGATLDEALDEAREAGVNYILTELETDMDLPAASSMSAGTRSARSWACPTPSSMIRRWPARPPWKRFVCSSSRTEKLPSASNGTREP